MSRLWLFFVLSWNIVVSIRGQETPSVRGTSPAANSCGVRVDASGQVWVANKVWFSIGRKCFRRGGKEHCPLSPKTHDITRGVDVWGDYQENIEFFDAGDFKQWKLTRRQYDQDDTTMLFRQTYFDDFEGTDVPAKDPITAASTGVASWFPSFHIPETTTLGYLEFNGMFIGAGNHKIAPLSEMRTSDALRSGPIAIFDEKCVVILSADSSFMSSSSLFREEWNEFGFGVLGSVTNIPHHYDMSTILSSSPRTAPDGIRQAFTDWGAKLQKFHNTKRMKDVTLDYLQYSTDNGAYYYYHTEKGENYQNTMRGVKAYAEKIGLPIKSWLMDSWFYYQGKDSGVKEWTARPDIFPDGLKTFREEMKWLTMAHNRYWSTETVYAKQNGGDFDFVIEEKGALPLEESFWDYLFDEAKAWGMDVYEQDWLNVQTQSMNHTLKTVDGAATWLLQMGKSAERHNVPIQYCMSWPRHILMSLQIDAVTQARGSDDVLPNNEKSIQLGVTSMLSHALGVTPHKDSFWSTPGPPPNNPYKHFEEASKLLSIMATYSTGPVAPSDKKERLNVNLIMKSCAQDGTLLKPDKPAVRTDATILSQAGIYVNSQQRDQVWSTSTTLSGYSWSYILSASSPEFRLKMTDIYASEAKVIGHVAWNLDTDGVIQVQSFPDTLIPQSSRTDCYVFAIAPIFENGWAFLGEAITKWTAVSQNRFSRLEVNEDGFSVEVTGAPFEKVELWLQNPNDESLKVDCALSLAGRAVFLSTRMICVLDVMDDGEDTNAESITQSAQ